MKTAWIKDVPWELVVWQNEQLCLARKAHHGPTSDGHEDTRVLWNAHHRDEFDLPELADFCRKCHRMAPFTNYNGNTFSAIMRAIIDDAGFPTDRKVLARSLAGHIVAGVAEEGEVEAFRELCAKLGG
jgi:hypothetical protein